MMAKKIGVWFFTRLIAVMAFLLVLNEVYKSTLYPRDVQKFSRVKNRIDSAFALGDIVYLGESSNTSFNPWTDTLNQSIGDFLQLYIQDGRRVEQITHEGYHPGLFLKMLNLLPEDVQSGKTVILGVNMRTCGPTAMFSGNEASNQREALFYTKRPPLLTRIFMGLHFYDNRNELERESLKVQWWRTQKLPVPEKTVMLWNEGIAQNYHSELSPEIKAMAGAYIKEFGFILDDENQRVRDLKEIVNICKGKGLNLIFHVLPPNRYHAKRLFGEKLVNIMDANHDFLMERFKQWGVETVDNYFLNEANEINAVNKGSYYTDQWYPTEHFNAHIRRAIAENIAARMLKKSPESQEFQAIRTSVSAQLKQNNYPNWSIIMPLSDSLIRTDILNSK
jgi:hypothetical protein